MIVVAALGGWLVHGIHFDSDAPPAPRATQPFVVKSEPVAEPPSVVLRVAEHAPSRGGRNLFAYRVHEQPVMATRAIEHVAPILPPPHETIVETPAPQPIPFPYRYIGTFGPPHRRVAAFKRDGDVVTVFAGQRIGEFTLRSIGMESVEVEGPDGTRRIPLTSDL